MALLEMALGKDKTLANIEGTVGGGVTGEWTIATAKELSVETPVISSALDARKRSQMKSTFAGKIVSTLRNQFGGHPLLRK